MRYAICNETFEGWDHARVCRFVAETGYTGLEIAPFTLAPLVTDITTERRREVRRQAEDNGLTVVGLHWLLARTQGFELTSPDGAVRRKTGDYFAELARCCRDMGGTVLVLGSPVQRRVPPGATRAEAFAFAADTLARAAPALEETGVLLCLEPLTPAETDFLNTAAEGVELMNRVAHPNVRLHLDVKAMSSEAEPIPELIRQYAPVTGHFHANDPNKRGPGFGAVDFKPIFRALKEASYGGWVSVEVFDYTPDPETIARESIRYMRECE
jgi:sugar phosphate isomerase/epimerase